MAAKATDIAGTKARPMPTPRTSSTIEIPRIEVVVPMKHSGIVERHSTLTPASARRPPPKRSVRRPVTGITSSIPSPCGPTSRPVTSTLSWRTSW